MIRVIDKISEMASDTSLDVWVKDIVKDCTKAHTTEAERVEGERALQCKVTVLKHEYYQLTGTELLTDFRRALEDYIPLTRKALDTMENIQICNQGLEQIRQYWLENMRF